MKRRKLRIDRLVAAKEASKYKSTQELARASGVTHATLSRLLSDEVEQDQVNEKTAYRLAATLHVPLEWLEGKIDRLPDYPEHAPPRSGRSKDAEAEVVRRVRISWLMRRADDALLRDLTEWLGEEGKLTHTMFSGGFGGVVFLLASPVEWGEALLIQKGQPLARLLDDDNRDTTDWITGVLSPWFEGKTYLNAAGLLTLHKMMWTESGKRNEEFWEDLMVDALQGYDRLLKKHVENVSNKEGTSSDE